MRSSRVGRSGGFFQLRAMPCWVVSTSERLIDGFENNQDLDCVSAFGLRWVERSRLGAAFPIPGPGATSDEHLIDSYLLNYSSC